MQNYLNEKSRNSAEYEPAVKPSELMEEILPLWQEYFLGEITLLNGAIRYRLPNGQVFEITAKAV